MDKSKVDIILINWNGRHLLDDCFDSIYKQNYTDFGVIFVDNNSSDGSVEYISNKYKGKKNLKIYGLDRNVGFAAANNFGIKHSRADYIALLNNDAVAKEDWLEESVRCLELHEDAGFCASKIVNFYDRDRLDTAGDIYTRGGVNGKRGHGKLTDSYDEYEYIFGACAAAALYRRRMLDDIGFFDEDFFIMCEDVDLSFRAQLAGYRCIYSPVAVVYHKIHGTIKEIDRVFSYYGQRNLEYVYFKNMPIWPLIFNLPGHIVYNIAILFYFTLKGQLVNLIRSKVDFLLNLPATMRKRKKIQSGRRVPDGYISSLITRSWFFVKLKKKLSDP